jgi:Leucine-rich repeat (LRR) protein
MLGNFNGMAVATPVSISTGATFGSNTPGTPGNLKLKLYDNNSSTTYGLGISSGVMEYQVPNGADHRFYVDGNEIMRLTNTGNVAIGTLSTSYKLDVNGTIRTTGLLFPTGAGNGKLLMSDASGNASWLGLGTSLQQLRVNAAGTGLEYFTPSGGGSSQWTTSGSKIFL